MAQISRIRRYETKVGNPQPEDLPEGLLVTGRFKNGDGAAIDVVDGQVTAFAPAPLTAPIAAFLRSVDVHMKQTQIRKFLGMTAEALTREMMEDKGSNEIKQTLFKHVAKFENLEIVEEDQTIKPLTIEDAWSMGEFELCLELFTNILQHSQLKAEETKNSVSQSGSIPQSGEAGEMTGAATPA